MFYRIFPCVAFFKYHFKMSALETEWLQAVEIFQTDQSNTYPSGSGKQSLEEAGKSWKRQRKRKIFGKQFQQQGTNLYLPCFHQIRNLTLIIHKEGFASGVLTWVISLLVHLNISLQAFSPRGHELEVSLSGKIIGFHRIIGSNPTSAIWLND